MDSSVFMDTFDIQESQLNDELVYQSIEEWDSVGHMSLMAALEGEFDIELEIDEIINLSSYNIGRETLATHNVTL